MTDQELSEAFARGHERRRRARLKDCLSMEEIRDTVVPDFRPVIKCRVKRWRYKRLFRIYVLPILWSAFLGVPIGIVTVWILSLIVWLLGYTEFTRWL